MKKYLICGLLLSLQVSPAFALNVLLVNDDGLTSNLKALYDELKANGHNVLVSVPCSPQSGRSGAIVMYSNTTISATNDQQIETENGCHNGAAPIGAPSVGSFTKAGYTNGDWNYAHGTPVTATMYGLDVLASKRWGKAPDLVLSGPNEGQNIGKIVVNSGTIGNVQLAASRGVPSIALSASTNTVDDSQLSNPNSKIVAQRTLSLIKALQNTKGELLPTGMPLNVNFPDNLTNSTPFAFSKIGTYDAYSLKFDSKTNDIGFSISSTAPTAAQASDESVVVRTNIAVTAMQVAFEQRPAGQEWLKIRLKELFK